VDLPTPSLGRALMFSPRRCLPLYYSLRAGTLWELNASVRILKIAIDHKKPLKIWKQNLIPLVSFVHTLEGPVSGNQFIYRKNQQTYFSHFVCIVLLIGRAIL